MTRLADILAQATKDYGDNLPNTAVVDTLNADGTVDLRYLGGIARSVGVVATYAPVSGDVVQIIRRGPSSLIVIGPIRTVNTVANSAVATDLIIAYNVQPVPTSVTSSGTYTYTPSSSGSYRTADKWGSPVRDELRQGAYFSSTQFGYYQGAWFYGTNAFTNLRGLTVTSATLTMRRKTGSGVFAAEPIYVYTTKNPTRPTGAPFYVKYVGAYSLAVGDSAVFNIPTWVATGLASGAYHGLGIKYNGTADYLAVDGIGAYNLSGRLQVGWTE